MSNIKSLLHQANQQLTQTSDTPQLDAELLLSKILQVTRTYLYTHPEQQVTNTQQKAFQQLLQRRITGEPIAYILGKREFWSLDFAVSPATLIPRPETELIIEWALKNLPANQTLEIADLGTGSGIIALTLAKNRPHWKIIATDIATETLAVAKHNAQQLKISNVTFYQGNWCQALPQQIFDVIVSNPPYIASEDPHLCQGDVRFEPQRALVSGKTGLEAITAIIKDAPTFLKPKAWLVLEHGDNQAGAIQSLMKSHGFTTIASYQDLAAKVRITTGRLR